MAVPDWQKMQPKEILNFLYEQNQALEKVVRANDATLRHLYQRVKWLEEKLAKIEEGSAKESP